MTAFVVRSADTLAELDLALPRGRWCVLLAMDASEVSTDDISRVHERLLEEGMVYLCTWGPDCERVHDICDEVLVMQEVNGERPEGDDNDVIMTTWHSDEPLADAAWFAANSAFPAKAYEATFAGTIAMLVGLGADAVKQATDGATGDEPDDDE